MMEMGDDTRPSASPTARRRASISYDYNAARKEQPRQPMDEPGMSARQRKAGSNAGMRSEGVAQSVNGLLDRMLQTQDLIQKRCQSLRSDRRYR
jgi:hypothetical protein